MEDVIFSHFLIFCLDKSDVEKIKEKVIQK